MVCDVVSDAAFGLFHLPVQLEACSPLAQKARSEAEPPSNETPQLEAGAGKLAKCCASIA